MRVLIVCSANVCRSRLAEAHLVRILEPLPVAVAVDSAAVLLDGLSVPEEISEILARLGQPELAERPGRMVTHEELEDADLIVGMTREHVREAVVRDRSVWPRTFTLKELVNRGSRYRGRLPGESLEVWLERLHLGRETSQLLGESPEDDVADPYGGTRAEYEHTAAEIGELIEHLVALIW
jgi:protein-tyrosine phosphatase